MQTQKQLHTIILWQQRLKQSFLLKLPCRTSNKITFSRMSTYKMRFVWSLLMKYCDQTMKIDLTIWINWSILPHLISFIFFPFFLSFFFNFFLLHSFQDFLKSFCKKNHSRYLFILPFFSARTFTFMTSLTTRACNEVLNNISLCNFLLNRKRCPRKKSPHPKFFVQFLWFFWVALKFLLCDNQKTITF